MLQPDPQAPPSLIPPTVGRVVWFHSAESRGTNQPPFAAVVAAVWGDRCVNLMVVGRNGVPWSHPPTSVTLVQPGDEVPAAGPYCTWMPFQVGQAQARPAAG